MRPFKRELVPFPKGYEGFDVDLLQQPIYLEIGAGAGLHSVAFAKAHPDATLLAVEHSTERFSKLKGRRDSHPQLKNLLVFHADAESVVTHLLPKACLLGVFLLYPNPYPKMAQANKRWHRMPFWGELLSKLSPLGRIYFASNEASYASEFRSWNELHWDLCVEESRAFSKAEDPLFRPRTHFEKKYFDRSETLYLMTLRRP